MSNWNKSQKVKPPKGRFVVGLHLWRFDNAPWEWSTPYITAWLGDRWHPEYTAPEVWMAIEMPKVPSK